MASKRALIVDDSRSARAFLARLLERQGLEVDGVGSASEAYAYLRRQLPDVLFLDHLMPGADGFEVLRVLKKDGRTRAIPVLMYTSQQGDEYLAQAQALGAVGVLPKQLRALDVTNALDQLGMRSEPGATQAPAQATTVVGTQPRAGAPSGLHVTTVVDARAAQAALQAGQLAGRAAGPGFAPRPPAAPTPSAPVPVRAATMGAAPARGAASSSAEGAPLAGVNPELRSLLEALVREQGLALRQQVSQLVTQQGERLANELRAIRREMADMNERAAARAPAANAIAASGARRDPPAGLAPGVRVLIWIGVVLVLLAALAGASWLLRPGLWAGFGTSPALRPQQGAGPQVPTSPAGNAPLFAAPAQSPAPAPAASGAGSGTAPGTAVGAEPATAGESAPAGTR